MPKISVIVPVYKVEKYLDRCVESILSQTFTDFELWLVDDGSPDNCPLMCDEWAKKDNRIKVIHKKNGGLSDARNAALDKITGEYVAFVDSDDFITNDALETLYNSLVKNDADISVGNIMSFDESGKFNDFYLPSDCEKILEKEDLFQTMSQPCAPSKLYKAVIYKDLRFYVGKLYEDVFIWHKVLMQVKKIVLTGKTDYYYFIRSGSIMHSEYNIRFTDIIDAVKERYEWLDSIGQERLANEARMFVYTRVAVAYANLDSKNPVHMKRLEEISRIYKDCYSILIKDKNVSVNQKIRLALLRYFPNIHTKLFGRKMPIALG